MMINRRAGECLCTGHSALEAQHTERSRSSSRVAASRRTHAREEIAI